MIDFPVKNRFSNEIQFVAKIEADEASPIGLKLRRAVLWAIAEKADLTSADLRSANLMSADLRYADLRSANLMSADLRYADLRSANLRSASLRSASLTSADLRSANLTSADLTSADLRYADLRSANLTSADLMSASLTSANLTAADLSSTTGGDCEVHGAPLQIYGLRWEVTISDTFMAIGCQRHLLAAWEAFDTDAIARMDVGHARRFWETHKEMLLGLARAGGRVF